MPPLLSRLLRAFERDSNPPQTIPDVSSNSRNSLSDFTVMALSASNLPEAETVINDMMAVLQAYLPASISGLPEPSVSTKSITHKPLAIGNDRGLEQRGLLGSVALKGGRLDAVIRFQLWGTDPTTVESAMQLLQSHIMTDRLVLQAQGFLQLGFIETSVSEHIASLSAWRISCDLKLLYEYHYDDTDGAESIIARIPIHSDPEFSNTPNRETSVITDAIVRWDDESATTLSIVGATNSTIIYGLASLSYLPAPWTGHSITLSRLNQSSLLAPTIYMDLTTFVTAVTDPNIPDLHAQVTFSSVQNFLNEFLALGDPIQLGDWDEDNSADTYQMATLSFSPPIRLEGNQQLFQLSYQDAVLDSKAVIYWRGSTHTN